MAAPEYVPRPPDQVARVYGSPPWRPESWMAYRPSDLRGRQPLGPLLGRPGPDQGYALRLVRQFEGKLVLAEGEDEDDVIAGCVGVALKRASYFGRAPIIHDLTVAFTVWGFLREAPPDLVEFRRPLFAEVANPYHYDDARRIVDLVPDSTLQMTPEQVREQARRDWRSLLRTLDELPDAAGPVAEVAPPEAEPEPEPVAEVVPPEPEPETEPRDQAAPSEPSEPPEPSEPAGEPALRPAPKVAPAAPSPTRPAAKKKVVKKKVIKKVVKKKAAKKPDEGDGSLFARPPDDDPESAADDAARRARDLGHE